MKDQFFCRFQAQLFGSGCVRKDLVHKSCCLTMVGIKSFTCSERA